MKTIILTLLTLLLAIGVAVAQESSSEIIFNDIEYEKKETPKILAYTINKDDNYVILVSRHSSKTVLTRYFLEIRSPKMDLLKEIDILSEFEIENHLKLDVELELLNDKLILIVSDYNFSKKVRNLFMHSIDVNEFTKPSKILIYSNPNVKSSKKKMFFAKTSVSTDLKNILIYFDIKKNSKEGYLTQMKSYNQDLTLVWEKKDLKRFYMPDFLLGNDGAAYLLQNSKIIENKTNIKLIKIGKGEIEEEELILDGEVKELFLTSVNENLFLTGYYTNARTNGKRGLYAGVINKEKMKLTSESKSKFTDEMILEGYNPEEREKKKQAAKARGEEVGTRHNLNVEYVLQDKKGSVFVLGSYYIYNQYLAYRAIYITKFSSSYEHLFTVKVPLNHVCMFGDENFYSPRIIDGELSLVFIDAKENMNQKYVNENGAKRSKFSYGFLEKLTVSVNGVMKREVIYDFIENEYKIFEIMSSFSSYFGTIGVVLRNREYKISLIE